MTPNTQTVPLVQIDYRWSTWWEANPSKSQNMVDHFTLFEGHLRNGTVPGVGQNMMAYWHRVKAVFDSVKEHGLVNPLMAFQVPDDDRMLSLRGNQRLCSLRALNVEEVEVWMTTWGQQEQELAGLYQAIP